MMQSKPMYSASEGDRVEPRTKLNGILSQSVGDKYLEWSSQGLMHTAYSNTALAMKIFSTPTNSPTLWNPDNSGKVIVVTRIGLAHSGGATLPISGLGLLMSFNMGRTQATGQPFATFTELDTIFCHRCGLKNSKARFSVVQTWTTIPTTTRWIGKGQFTMGTAAAAGFGDMSFEPNGSLVLFPGMAVSVMSSVASASTFMPTIEFAELPQDRM